MTIVEHQPHRGAPLADLPTTMQAGVLVGTRALELRTFEVPRPGPGQALVRIRATALCPGFVATDMSANASTVDRADMIRPGDLAELVACLLALPNNATIAELLVNMRYEDTL